MAGNLELAPTGGNLQVELMIAVDEVPRTSQELAEIVALELGPVNISSLRTAVYRGVKQGWIERHGRTYMEPNDALMALDTQRKETA